MAPAEKGLGKRSDGTGACGVTGVVPFCAARPAEGRSAGVMSGLLKQRR